MGIISTLISFILFLICCVSTKDRIKNPLVFYFALWTMILGFSSMHLYGMIIPSDKTYCIINTMNICFFLGGLVKMPRKKAKILSKQEIECNERWFFILLIISIVFKSFGFFSALQSIASGAQWWQIRQSQYILYGTDPSSNSLMWEVIENVVVNPFATLLIPISAYLIFRAPNKRITRIANCFTILFTIMDTVSGGGGRLGYIYLIGCYIYSFLFLHDRQKIKNIYKKYKRKIKKILFVSLTVLVFVTIFRVGVNNVFRQIYTYFGMTPALLDVNLAGMEYAERTFGLLTLFGFHSYIFRFFSMIGIQWIVPEAYERAYQYLLSGNTFKQVGFGTANAFVSPAYYFYLDGGIIFVIFASFIFGVIVSNAYYSIRKNLNIKTFCIYSLIMNAVFLTFIRIQTVIPSFVISIFLVLILVNKRKKLK